MRVLLVNVVSLNGGDAAIMKAILRHIESALGPNVDTRVHDSHAMDAARRYPGVSYRLPAARALQRARPFGRRVGRVLRELDERRWLTAASLHSSVPLLSRMLLRPFELRKLREYATADLVVATGGTYLVQHYATWPKLFELKLAIALRRPLILYTQSIGVPRGRGERRSLRRVVAAARLVLLRDERSWQHLLALRAIPTRKAVVADVAFSLPAPANARGLRLESRPLRRVAISVRSWHHFDEPFQERSYERGVQALVTSLVRTHRAEVTFVSTCQGTPEYWTDDSALAADLVAELPDDVRPSVHVDREFRPPECLMELLATFDLAVTTRMHAAILALNAGVPVLPIAYEFKTRELFARLGLERFVLDIERVDESSLIELFEAFVAAAPEWEPFLSDGVAAERELANRARDLLAASLGPHQRKPVRPRVGA